MLVFGDGITWKDITTLGEVVPEFTEDERITLSGEDCFARTLGDGTYEWDSLKQMHEGVFAGLSSKLNTGHLTVDDRQNLLAHIDTTRSFISAFVPDIPECKRQLVFVSGEFNYNEADSILMCIFMRWLEYRDGTKRIAPTQYAKVIVLRNNSEPQEGFTHNFSSYPDSSRDTLVNKSIVDVMICPYCNSNSNCEIYINKPSDIDADMSSDNTGNYSVRCLCNSCMRSFNLNLKFKYELTSASCEPRY